MDLIRPLRVAADKLVARLSRYNMAEGAQGRRALPTASLAHTSPTFEERDFRLLILGAGFSQLAGYPLGAQLWAEARAMIDSELGGDNVVRHDIADFLKYKQMTTGIRLPEDQVDFEEFIAFLDLEHYLGLLGSDTWSSEGNPSQLIVKWAIGRVLYERLENLTSLPDSYLRFADRLRPGDIIITFNYDTLLEAALTYVGKEFRLFPHRFSSIGLTANTIDSSRDEVVLLKLHGSIDWFDRSGYDERKRVTAATSAITGTAFEPKDPVFGPDRIVGTQPLVDGPRAEGDPLGRLFRVLDPGPLYRSGYRRSVPFILAPSSNKLLYSAPLLDFWNGLGKAGAWQLGLGIVGFSLPAHDEYLRQVLYRVSANYTDIWWDENFAGRFKATLKLVDRRRTPDEVTDLRARYHFLNWERTEVFLDGFGPDAVDFLFAASPRGGTRPVPT